MKKALLSVCFLLPAAGLQAQVTGQSPWKWAGGDSVLNLQGLYGAKGQEHPAHQPRGRSAGTTWKDANGNLWLFGGETVNPDLMIADKLNDLWKFNPLTGAWAWVSGDSTVGQAGNYISKGVTTAVNSPGARSRCASWVDRNGNFWIFGGKSHGAGTNNRNDLWKFSPPTREWTWVGGDSSLNGGPVYGIRGVSSATNMPGSRNNAASWVDAAGNFWLFGGNGYAGNGGPWRLNDLWKYDPLINEWTWMSGDTLLSRPGVYGTQGIPAAANKPGAREVASCWTDGQGTFWLFGGNGQGTTAVNGLMSDLWSYNPAFQQWTWVGGDTAPDVRPVYGVQDVAAPTSKPGGRQGSPAWTDAAGNCWLYGGIGLAAAGPAGRLGDLWKYNRQSNEWTWVKGDSGINAAGVYGVRGIAGAANHPDSRTAPMAWSDEGGSIWLFGGFVSAAASGGFHNDLWQLEVPQALGIAAVAGGQATVFPNPVRNGQALQVRFDKETRVQWQVTDAAGKVLLQSRQAAPATSLSVEVSGLPPGRYYLLLKGDHLREAHSFLKL